MKLGIVKKIFVFALIAVVISPFPSIKVLASAQQIINEEWDSFDTNSWSFSGTNLTHYEITYSSTTYLCVNRSSDTYHSGEATVSWIGASISTYYFNATADNVRFSYLSTFSPEGKFEFRVGSYKIAWIINSSGKFVDFYAGTTLLGSHSAISGISSYATFTVKRDIGSSQVYLEFNNPGVEVFYHYTSTILQVDSVELYFYLEVDALNDYKAAWWVDKTIFWDLSKLDTPSITAPAEGSWTNESNVQLSWSSVTNADEYHVQVSDQSDFSTLAVNTTVTTTSLTFSAPSNGKWYWRVRAIASDFNPSNWNSSNFWVDTIAPVVTLSSPSNGSEVSLATATLQWSSSDNLYLDVQKVFYIYPNGTKSNSSLLSNVTGSYDITSDDGPIHWWLYAWDNASNRGISSNWTLFIDTRLPNQADLIYPANNSWITTDTLTIQYNITDYDVNVSRLYVTRTEGGYTLNVTKRGFGLKTHDIVFPAEGQYEWWVESIDWVGNSVTTSHYIFYVVIGSITPENLSGTASGFAFDAVEHSGSAQTATYTAYAYRQDGTLVDTVSGSFSISANSRTRITGYWSATLAPAIYKLKVAITDESGSKKTNETWFLVASGQIGSYSRDWTQWACDENIVGKEVNFSRLYFEYSESGQTAHQVSLSITGRPSSAYVWLLNSTFHRTTEIAAEALTNQITFTAQSLAAGGSKTYAIYAFLPELTVTETVVDESVSYGGVLAKKIKVDIKNQHPYEIYKVIYSLGSDDLGWEGSGWIEINSTSIYYSSLSGKETATLYIYRAITATEEEEAEVVKEGMNISVVMFFFLIVVFGFMLVSARARRRSE